MTHEEKVDRIAPLVRAMLATTLRDLARTLRVDESVIDLGCASLGDCREAAALLVREIERP